MQRGSIIFSRACFLGSVKLVTCLEQLLLVFMQYITVYSVFAISFEISSVQVKSSGNCYLGLGEINLFSPFLNTDTFDCIAVLTSLGA